MDASGGDVVVRQRRPKFPRALLTRIRTAIGRSPWTKGRWVWLMHPRQELAYLSLAPFYGKRGPFKMRGTPEECAMQLKRWIHRRGA